MINLESSPTVTMKIKSLFIVVVAIAILMSSCKPKITEGVVVEKSFRPAHTELEIKMIGEMIYLNTDNVPDTWVVVLENNGARRKFKVSKEKYHDTEIGDTLKIEKSRR